MRGVKTTKEDRSYFIKDLLARAFLLSIFSGILLYLLKDDFNPVVMEKFFIGIFIVFVSLFICYPIYLLEWFFKYRKKGYGLFRAIRYINVKMEDSYLKGYA